MKTAAFLFTILIGLALSAFPQAEIDAEEYEVYRAWLAGGFLITSDKPIVVMKDTDVDQYVFTEILQDKRPQLSQLQSSTAKNFRSRNRRSIGLRNEFGDDLVVHLVARDEFFNGASNLSANEEIAKKFSGEYRIGISRVGFNKTRDQALLHVNFRSNWDQRWGHGSYFLFSKQNGKWIVREYVRSWVV